MSENYLIHFGIKRKSGRYPFGSGERPHQHDGLAPPKKRYRTKDVVDDFNNKMAQNKDIIARSNDTSDKMNELSNQLAKDYDNAYKGMKTLSKESKTKIEKELHKEFGSGCDDDYLFDQVLEEHIEKHISSSIPKTVQNKRKQFDSLQESYWKDIHSITDDLNKKYKNANIRDGWEKQSGELIINQLMGEKLDTRWNAYMYRHFDDYWVNDVDSRYKAIDRLKNNFGMTMDDYNKKYGSK